MNTSATSYHSILTLYYHCAYSTEGTYIFVAWFAVYLLFLPLFLLVLHMGFTKWWKKQHNSVSTSISHIDAITFNMAAQEVLNTIGASLFIFALDQRHYGALASGIGLISFTMSGQLWLHALTCIERYLAVVRPIMYLRLKKRSGVTMRNISISVVWLISTVYMVVHVTASNFMFPAIVHFLGVGVVLVTVIFCSVSVLCVLIRPGPGGKGGNRKRIDQSKLSAFITIITILGVLLVRMVQLIVLAFWLFFIHLDQCIVAMSTFWFSLPSSLVLPLLFLYREGKLSTCC